MQMLKAAGTLTQVETAFSTARPLVEAAKMPRRPAVLTQADITRVIRAAKQAGADNVEVRIGGSSIVIRLGSSTTDKNPLDPAEEIIL